VNRREQAQENGYEVFSKCSDENSSYIKSAAFFTSGINLKTIYFRLTLGKKYTLEQVYHPSSYVYM
jgi:hypothetical protein